jgi:hypothetical protein
MQNCCITLINVAAQGCENDSSFICGSNKVLEIGKAFSSGDLNVPPMRNTVQSQI